MNMMYTNQIVDWLSFVQSICEVFFSKIERTHFKFLIQSYNDSLNSLEILSATIKLAICYLYTIDRNRAKSHFSYI